VFEKIECICEHSPHPRGEDIPRQPTPAMGPSMESSPQKSRLPADNRLWHRQKRKRNHQVVDF
jgi:hypothetical protein